MHMKNKIAWFLTIFLCLNARFIGAQGKRSMSTKEYIDSFHEFAMQEMRNHGVPASITLGQAMAHKVTHMRWTFVILAQRMLLLPYAKDPHLQQKQKVKA